MNFIEANDCNNIIPMTFLIHFQRKVRQMKSQDCGVLCWSKQVYLIIFSVETWKPAESGLFHSSNLLSFFLHLLFLNCFCFCFFDFLFCHCHQQSETIHKPRFVFLILKIKKARAKWKKNVVINFINTITEGN